MRILKRLGLGISTTLVVAALMPTPAQAAPDFANLINSERDAIGLPLLQVDAALVASAAAHSARMAEGGRVFHSSSLKANFPQGGWARLGENVGVGTSIEKIHGAFMVSPSHRDNVLGDFDRVGVAIAKNGPAIFVTVVFWKTAAAKAPDPRPAQPSSESAPPPNQPSSESAPPPPQTSVLGGTTTVNVAIEPAGAAGPAPEKTESGTEEGTEELFLGAESPVDTGALKALMRTVLLGMVALMIFPIFVLVRRGRTG